ERAAHRLGHEVRLGLVPRNELADRIAPHRAQHRGRALQHGVFAEQEHLAGRRDDGGASQRVANVGRRHPTTSGATRAPGPGEATMMRRTPGVAASALATTETCAASHSTLTCGPASMVKNAAIPRARRSRTVCMAAMVAADQYRIAGSAASA